MYHDKTIYILKAHVKESVMGRVFFPGGAPPPLTGGGYCPPFFQNFYFCKKYLFFDRGHSTDGLRRKKTKIFQGGPFPLTGGATAPDFSIFSFFGKIPKTIYILNQQHLVCLMSKKNIEKIWPGGGSAPHLREILCS